MKMISTKIHGFHDYFTWILLLVSPWLFRIANGKAEMWILIALGISTLLLSILTDYEFGLFKVIKMKTHIAIDVATGLLLVISPWVLGFSERVYLPHVAIGGLQLLVAFGSQITPYAEVRRKRMWRNQESQPAENEVREKIQ